MVYGRYLSDTAPGYSIALDECGGHIHDSFDYHYHSQVINITGNTKLPGQTTPITSYFAYLPGPYKCNICINNN